MEQVLTFDKLPEAVTRLIKEVSELKSLFIEKQTQTTPVLPEQFLSIQEAAVFLGLSVPTIYSMCSRNCIPFMKRSKRLYFSSKELIEYLKEGRKKSNAEIEREANAYLKKKGGNNA